MGAEYQLEVGPFVAAVVSDLLTGTNTAGESLRDVLDKRIKIGGPIGEIITDETLRQFSAAWGTIAKSVHANVEGVTITAEEA